jgi:hypothetical protein
LLNTKEELKEASTPLDSSTLLSIKEKLEEALTLLEQGDLARSINTLISASIDIRTQMLGPGFNEYDSVGSQLALASFYLFKTPK